MRRVLIVLASSSVFLVSQTAQLQAQGMFLEKNRHGLLLGGSVGLSQDAISFSLDGGISIQGVLGINGTLGTADIRDVPGVSVTFSGLAAELYLHKPHLPRKIGIAATGGIARTKVSFRGSSNASDSGFFGVIFYRYEEINENARFLPSLSVSRSSSLKEGDTSTSISAAANFLLGLQKSPFVISPSFTQTFGPGGSFASLTLSAGALIGY